TAELAACATGIGADSLTKDAFGSATLGAEICELPAKFTPRPARRTAAAALAGVSASKKATLIRANAGVPPRLVGEDAARRTRSTARSLPQRRCAWSEALTLRSNFASPVAMQARTSGLRERPPSRSSGTRGRRMGP